jgi:O-antigen/teichoic acid export membrane protein
MLKWCFKSFLFTKISVAQAIAGTTITIVGVILFSWKATGVLVVSGVTFFLAGIWANVAVKDYILPVRISKIKLKEMAIYSWPLLGLNIFAYFTRSFDRIFLASLSSLNSVGIFSVSFAVASVFETFVSGFFFAWGPHVIASYRDPSSPRRYAEYFSLLSSLGILSIIVLGLWGGPIVQIIRPDGMYKEIGIYIPWIISGTLIYYLGGYFAPGPNIKKKTYWNLIAFAIAAVINAGLNLMLIPKFGILGAGVATTISSLVAGSFMQIVSNRFYFIPNRWKLSFLIIIATTSIVSAVQNTGFLYNINDHSLPARMMYTIVMTLAIIPFHREIRDSFINIKLKLTSRHESA